MVLYNSIMTLRNWWYVRICNLCYFSEMSNWVKYAFHNFQFALLFLRFTPSLLSLIGPKVALVLGGLSYVLFISQVNYSAVSLGPSRAGNRTLATALNWPCFWPNRRPFKWQFLFLVVFFVSPLEGKWIENWDSWINNLKQT